MFAQKIAPRIRDDSLLATYLKGQQQMEALHDGPALGAAAREVLRQLPAGELTLVATSTAGTALAATCAALREEPTRWLAVDLSLPAQIDGPMAIVEPVDAGASWRDALSRRYPQACFFHPGLEQRLDLAA
jgi:hypothetical protein